MRLLPSRCCRAPTSSPIREVLRLARPASLTHTESLEAGRLPAGLPGAHCDRKAGFCCRIEASPCLARGRGLRGRRLVADRGGDADFSGLPHAGLDGAAGGAADRDRFPDRGDPCLGFRGHARRRAPYPAGRFTAGPASRRPSADRAGAQRGNHHRAAAGHRHSGLATVVARWRRHDEAGCHRARACQLNASGNFDGAARQVRCGSSVRESERRQGQQILCQRHAGHDSDQAGCHRRSQGHLAHFDPAIRQPPGQREGPLPGNWAWPRFWRAAFRSRATRC